MYRGFLRMRTVLHTLLAALLGLAIATAYKSFTVEKKPGAGAKGAPVRKDTEVPSAAVPVVTDRKPIAAGQSVGLDAGAIVSANQPPQQQVWVSGWVLRGERINVLLSDGRTLMEGDGILARVERTYIETKEGERFYLARPASPVIPAATVVAGPALNQPMAAAFASSASTSQQLGSWIRGEDGVLRLRESPSFTSR